MSVWQLVHHDLKNEVVTGFSLPRALAKCSGADKGIKVIQVGWEKFWILRRASVTYWEVSKPFQQNFKLLVFLWWFQAADENHRKCSTGSFLTWTRWLHPFPPKLLLNKPTKGSGIKDSFLAFQSTLWGLLPAPFTVRLNLINAKAASSCHTDPNPGFSFGSLQPELH